MAEMVNLYYTNKRECREDCDTLGINRRRVKSLRFREHNGIVEQGFKTGVFDGPDGELVYKPVVAMLRVKPEIVAGHLEQLQHDDDESTW